MGKGRLEAFSDGVIAIIITIMVLEMKAPEEPGLAHLWALWPVFTAYVLSYAYVAIYWVNHHRMFAHATRITNDLLWANIALLFTLSLVPFATAWMGEHYLSAWPVALYGVVLLMAALAYAILARLLVRHEGPGSLMAKAVGGELKIALSPVAYGAAIAIAFFFPPLSLALYAGVALCWLIPDPRIERAIAMK